MVSTLEHRDPHGRLAAELIAHCRERLIKWSCPRDVVFRAELPLTKIGKVDFRALEAEAISTAPPGGRAVCPSLADRG